MVNLLLKADRFYYDWPFLYNRSMEHEFLNKKWWWGWLEKNFEFLGGLNLSEQGNDVHFTEAHQFIQHFQFRWYKSAVAFVGYRYCEKKRPQFWVKRDKINVIISFNLEDSERELQILEALSKPDLLPLCLNTWAEPFVAPYFSQN